jgi:hypothetical protein
VALSAATAKTVIQLVAATNHRVKVLRWGVFFDGVSVSAEPVQVRLLRQTTAGTMSSLTPVKLDDSLAETLQTTSQHTATAEPTAGDVVDVVEVHPQSGYEIIYPLGQEVIIGGGDRLGIECTAPAGVNVRAKIVFEE